MEKSKIQTRLLLIAAILLTGNCYASQQMINENPVWSRPVIIPVPSENTTGLTKNVISLNGIWLSKSDTLENILTNPDDVTGWTEVTVPQTRRSRSVQNSFITTYKRKVKIPSVYEGKRVIIRFDGVSNAAKLWVNGTLVREHWGSFMSWTCDITDQVTPGKDVWISLTVDDTRIGLVPFVRAGGIQRDVKLYAVPGNYIQRFKIETDFDNHYVDATLKVGLKVAFHEGTSAKINLTLKDGKGKIVPIHPNTVVINSSLPEVKISIPVSKPLKWDVEHPNLYTLEASIGKSVSSNETVSKKFGFREVVLKGNQLLVNGTEVKLRGMWGGDNARDLRNLNVNHTRQKWATEAFLDSCDYYGVYVLDENPIDFAKYGAESDPRYTYQWMSFISDLMERDYSHPSIVMWGLGNESFSGDNVLKTHKYVLAEDPKRPTMFSWANRVKTTEEIPYSIYSFHYPSIFKKNNELADFGVAIWHSTSLIKERTPYPVMPVISDEYAHVVLSQEEMKRDPNVRNFWGESIKRFWEQIFTTQGALGGDQFGIFSDMGKNMPEPWLMRKAYSPIRINQVVFANPGIDKKLVVPIKNWFDHTNLNEITINWQIGNEKGVITGPKIAPHAEGVFELPARIWKADEKVELKFLRGDGFQIDEFVLRVNFQPYVLPTVKGPSPELIEDNNTITVRGEDFEIIFDKYKGQILSGTFKGKKIISGGPHLQFERSGMDVAEYWCQKISARKEQNEVVVVIDAMYSPIAAQIELRIDGKGLITTNYKINRFPDPPPEPKSLMWNQTDIGGYSEIGIFFELSSDIDRIQWDRKSLWTVYPEDHIGRPNGVAYKNADKSQPTNWSQMTGDRQFSGATVVEGALSTNDFRASKEYIREATAFMKNSVIGLQAVSEENVAVRMQVVNNAIRMYVNNEWNYPTLGLGNYMKDPIRIKEGYSNTVRVRFIDNSSR